MTIIPRNALSSQELDQLGNNFDEPFQRDPSDIDAMNRSLATLGETLDEQVEAATRAEHLAG